jgi:hypothetical protein
MAAAVLEGVLSETESARRARVDGGLRNAARFATGRMIETYENLYNSLLQRGRARTALAA